MKHGRQGTTIGLTSPAGSPVLLAPDDVPCVAFMDRKQTPVPSMASLL